MKKNIVIAFICVLLSSVSISQGTIASLNDIQEKKFKPMIGLWEFVDQDNSKGTLEIIDNTTILIRFKSEQKKLLNYKIDITKSPFWFDFSVRDTASIQNFKSLIDFVNEDILKWQIFDGERSDHYSSSEDILYLKRVRAKSNTFVSAN
jgi:hypothetical protein